MLGRESPQHSFLDAAWSAEALLEGEGFYEVLYREGPRLYPDEAQVVDSTAVWGRGAVEDTYRLIGSAVRKLLGVAAERRDTSAEEVATGLGLQLTGPAETGSLKGRAEIDWSEEDERRAFLNAVVEEARTLLRATRPEQAADPAVREAAGLLAQVLCQDLEPVEEAPPEEDGSEDGPSDPELSLGSGPEADEPSAPEGEPEEPPDPVLEPGRPVKIRRGVATDRVVSVEDPEMRHGHKSRNRRWDGYKVHLSVSADSEFVTGRGGDPGQRDGR